MVATIRPGSAQAVAEYALARLDETKTLDLVDVTPPDGEQLLANVAADLRLIGLALGGLVVAGIGPDRAWVGRDVTAGGVEASLGAGFFQLGSLDGRWHELRHR